VGATPGIIEQIGRADGGMGRRGERRRMKERTTTERSDRAAL